MPNINIDPHWLKIEPMAVSLAHFVTASSCFTVFQGLLLPGEEKTLQLTVLVSHAVAAPLNLRIEKLSTLLIVHTLFGQDLFLSLDGEYGTARPHSSFGWAGNRTNE